MSASWYLDLTKYEQLDSVPRKQDCWCWGGGRFQCFPDNVTENSTSKVSSFTPLVLTKWKGDCLVLEENIFNQVKHAPSIFLWANVYQSRSPLSYFLGEEFFSISQWFDMFITDKNVQTQVMSSFLLPCLNYWW